MSSPGTVHAGQGGTEPAKAILELPLSEKGGSMVESEMASPLTPRKQVLLISY